MIVLVLVRPNAFAPPAMSRWRPDQSTGAPIVLTAAADRHVDATMFEGMIVLQGDDGVYQDERVELGVELQEALAYVSTRFGSGPTGPITIMVVRDDSCGLHGIAYTDTRTAQVFSCPGIARRRAVDILAHEMVHQLAQDRYGPPHLSADMLLLEGIATWGAGRYWLGERPDFRSAVREQRAHGLYPLATSYEGQSTATMNALYYEWASFVEFLIATYGREAFDRLYMRGQHIAGSADYVGVYGKALATLEQEWQAWLDGG